MNNETLLEAYDRVSFKQRYEERVKQKQEEQIQARINYKTKIKTKQRKQKENMKSIIGLVIVAMIAMICIGGCRIVQDGEVGVKITLGEISDTPVGSGITYVIPFVQKMEKWNIKTQERMESLKAPSSEGLISTLEVSILYNVVPADAPKIRKNVGKDYENVIMIAYLRDEIRSVLSGQPVKALYSETGRTLIAEKILTNMKEKTTPQGVHVKDILIRDVDLPKAFLTSIEKKLTLEQEALQKEFELQKAVKDAEIEVARATGVAEANKIISGSITASYVQYLWVQGLNDGNSEVIYVPTEANLPILEATRK